MGWDLKKHFVKYLDSHFSEFFFIHALECDGGQISISEAFSECANLEELIVSDEREILAEHVFHDSAPLVRVG